MRDRLIELIKRDNCRNPFTCSPQCKYVESDDCHSERLADLILADGWIRPPVSVGQKVFIIDEGDEGTEPYILEVKVAEIGYDVSGFWIEMKLPLGLKQSAYVAEDSFGKTVFLSREETEAKLQEGKG